MLQLGSRSLGRGAVGPAPEMWRRVTDGFMCGFKGDTGAAMPVTSAQDCSREATEDSPVCITKGQNVQPRGKTGYKGRCEGRGKSPARPNDSYTLSPALVT